PVEARIGGAAPWSARPLPPRSRGGPVEACRSRSLGGSPPDLPPRSRGGPVEAHPSASPPRASPLGAFRLDHEAAPLKPESCSTLRALDAGAFRLDHEAAPLKPRAPSLTLPRRDRPSASITR